MASGRTRVVELAHDELSERDRGSIEGFLAHARQPEEPTSLDPFL